MIRKDKHHNCDQKTHHLLADRDLIIAANRGPFTLTESENGEVLLHRGAGGLVTALLGLVHHVNASWIASAVTPVENNWREGDIPLDEEGNQIHVNYIPMESEAYEGYYHQISNPLLWFLQHSMWDIVRSPNINRSTWDAWNYGYVAVNRLFGEAVANQVRTNKNPSLIMLQDYHLYLAPRMIRQLLRAKFNYTLTHFIHIPWPGSEDWGMLPPDMRVPILDSLCAVDLLGFQTREDSLNFIRTVESHLPGSHVNYQRGRIWYRNHATYIRDFPISIDVDAVRQLAKTNEVTEYREWFEMRFAEKKMIVRIDRTEPSKNIVRGFSAFEEMLIHHPEHMGKVQFLSIQVPSRLQVEEYQDYLNEIMAAAGRVNARFGSSEWEPVRVLLGEDYPRAIAAMQIYDVLLINAIADGMNLVAKEGPIVNRRDGVLILSERAGAHQQLADGALVISPCDIFATSEAMHNALTMPIKQRKHWAAHLRNQIENADINDWLCWQLDTLVQLGL